MVRRLLADLPDGTRADGTALLEIGFDQGPAVEAAVAALPGDWLCRVQTDLSGRPRLAHVERSPGLGSSLMLEPDLPIRLIALDIDGTLVGEDQVIGDRTLAAVAEAMRRGIAVSLVTGRMATSALPFADALGLTGPLVAQQGAMIRAMPPSRGPGAPADSSSIGR